MSAQHDVLPVGVACAASAGARHGLFSPQARICQACGVRRSSLFGVLDVAALEHIHGHIADRQVQPGQRLSSAHDPGLAAFTVREGVVLAADAGHARLAMPQLMPALRALSE